MCGRFTLASDAEALNQTFFNFAMPMDLSPRYNISPTQDVAVIANTSTDTGEHPEIGQIEFFHWGTHSVLGKRPKDRKSDDQCPFGDSGGKNLPSETLTSAGDVLFCQMATTNGERYPVTSSNSRCTFVSNRRSRSHSQGYGRYGRQRI